MEKITFGSVCSGIEAASVAWHPLGWRAAWLAEIEPFPSAVLAHHYPDVPNLGDMTKIAAMVRGGEVHAPDILVGGTPCQAFSVAGLRGGLSDPRGALTLAYVDLANAIDSARTVRGGQPCTVVWENVPGVLSSKDNAFGCFLAGLAGESCELQPPGGKWANAGCVFGPQRAVAWRVLDAQYFGVAQRRRRVFVVSSARNGFDPASVLFEFDGVRRDTAPSREARQNAAADAGAGAAGSSSVAFGGNRTSGSIDVTPALLAQPGSGWKGDFDSETFLVQSQGVEIGPSGGKLTDLNPTLDTRAKDGPIRNQLAGAVLTPAYAIQAGALRTNPDSGPDGVGVQADHAYTLEARAEVQCVAFDTTQITSKANYSNPQPGGPSHPLAAGAHAPAIAFKTNQTGANGCNWSEERNHSLSSNEQPPAIAFPANLSGTQCASAENLSPSLGAKNPTAVVHPVGVTIHGTDPTVQKVASYDEVAQCLRARTPGNIENSSTTVVQQPVAWSIMPQNSGRDYKARQVEVLQPLMAAGPQHGNQGGDVIQQAMQVRRLTPRECERLQGFPDDYTAIPWRKKPASECPDGPRYKALGNSMAVPVMAWIGRRIAGAA